MRGTGYGPGASLPGTAADYTSRRPLNLPDNAARFVVRLPENAQLTVETFQSRQTGPERYFYTPPGLQPGQQYEYTFRAQWQENGQTVTRDRTVRFQAGETKPVDFTQEPAR